MHNAHRGIALLSPIIVGLALACVIGIITDVALPRSHFVDGQLKIVPCHDQAGLHLAGIVTGDVDGLIEAKCF